MGVNKIAVIEIGECGNIKINNCDIYYFPNEITEVEIAEEILYLIDFYKSFIFFEWPPHLRKKEVLKWIKWR